MVFAEDGDMMLAFFKNMDKIFPTMGFVCLPLIRFKNPPLSGFLCLMSHETMKWIGALNIFLIIF